MSVRLPLARTSSLWWRVPLVALGYGVLAWLGFMVDIEPGFASSVWPAAGVGSAALLVFGPRLWPGVLIGSYAFNSWLTTVIEPTAAPQTWAHGLMALAIGTGATLQAASTAWVGRPLLASGDVLRSVRSAVPFLVLSGPAACLISATVGTAARFVAGTLPMDEVLANWYTWWLGDSIGVLALAPLTLVALPEAHGRRWRLLIRLVLPLLGVLFLIAFSHRATQESRRLSSSRAMAALQDELRRDMASPVQGLVAVARWVSATEAPDEAAFGRVFGDMPAFVSVSWLPSPTSEGPPSPALRFISAATDGADPSVAPGYAGVLARARDTGEAAITPPFSLDATRPARVAVVVPVFARPDAPSIASALDVRRSTLRGYVVGVVMIDQLTTQLARESTTLGFATRLADVTNPAAPILVMAGGRPATAGASLRVQSPVGFGGRTWQLDLAPMRPDLLPGETPDGRLLLAGAVVLMFLTGLFVVTEAGLGVAVAAEVTHRTAELSSEVIVRRRLEAVARENEARLGLALRGSRLAMWDLEVPTGRVLLSDGWGDILGQERMSSVVHINTLAALVHPDDLDRIRTAAFAALKGTTPEYSVEHRIRTTGGEWKWIHSHGMVTERSDDGRAVRMTGTNADVDERKRSEEAVAAAERRLREVTDGLPGAVYQLTWLLDTPMPTLTFVSKGIHELTGLAAEDVMADPTRLFTSVAEDDRERLLRSLREATLATDNNWSFDFHVTHVDGHLVSIRSQASRVGSGPRTVWNGSLVDIGPAVQAERALREARDEAERANRAKTAFLAAMSHEIRTPMNAILGMSELLEMSARSEEHREMLGAITASSESLLHILNDVLDLSKVEAGHLSLRPVDASIPDVVRSSALTFSGAATQKGLVLEWVVDPRIAARHLFDPVRLRQVVLNLVGNALKFTESGRIRIEADLVEDAPAAQTLCITVSDTGIGISPENQARLFQPFVQVDSPDLRHRGGTGLGLAISKRLVELMGGTIALRSALGEGTRVAITFTLPVSLPVTAPAPAEPRWAASIDAASTRPVLVVDDNAFNRSVLLKQIAMLGYVGEQASDGEEALLRWRQTSYGLILADCQMPGMDGLTLARTIRAEERQRGETSPVPILAWTANVMAEDVDAALDAGMNDVLAKPSALAMVQRALEAWLTRTAGHSASLPEVAPATPAVRPDVAPIDEEELRMIMNGDGRLTREILDGFRASGGREIASLERALADANAPEIRRIAHRLKGQARLVAAAGLAGACERIEHHAIAGAVDRAAAAQAAAEWESLKRYLDARPG